ncbi:MAG: indolepyruvate ferredoxin oxidoreductase subunit alpha [Bacteroidales bacterium]|nr:indolepyruvate ferredoxin oxidoreductase subunit alpha [Bacteroidales bacterium]
MSEKRLLLGDEAVALGALHAGLSGVYAYPGTPSTEITEYIQQSPFARERGVRSRWCTNEKTAMEAALGMSYAGKRALVCMKHVGMNVCADAFVNAAVTGVKGGLVVLAADDPSMHSSQNEQDSRFYGKFALVPVLEPSDQQEAYDMMAVAFALSESLKLPVLMRLVTRLAHSRAAVAVGEPLAQNALDPDSERTHWVLLPGNAKRQYASLVAKQPEILGLAEASSYNCLEIPNQVGDDSKNSHSGLDPESPTTGIIASGIAYNYVREAAPAGKFPLLKLSQYPLPAKQIRELAAHCSRILVVEDGQPFVEEQVRALLGAGYPVCGRLTGDLPRTGELTPDCVAAALGVPCGPAFAPARNLAPRPPQLCQGCGHRDVYTALNQVAAEYPDARIFGDIGCYTLGALPPFRAIDTCVDMGASITMAKGAADAGVYPAIAVIGDSTFTHSGMTGLLDAVNDGSDITVIISDNLTTAMTGGQDSAGTHKFEAICLALGVEREHLHVVVPLPANMPEITRILREEINYHGVSVIIPQRECMQTLGRKLRQKKQQ